MKFYILSLRHTHKDDFLFTFWGENNCGYRWDIKSSGIYKDENHRAKSCGEILVPCETIDKIEPIKLFYSGKLIHGILNNKKNRKIIGIFKKQLREYYQTSFSYSYHTIEEVRARAIDYNKMLESIND